MAEGFDKLVIVPVGIALFVFFMEWLAVQSKGTATGKRKFKLWFQEPGDTYPELPKDLQWVKDQIEVERREQRKKLIDIRELASIESFAGLGFDLVAAALTADILAYYKAREAQIPIPELNTWLVVHLLFLLGVVFLVTANGKAKPAPEGSNRPRNPNASRISNVWSWLAVGENHRTVLALLIGLAALITSFTHFWEALL